MKKFIDKIIDILNKIFYHCPSSYGLKDSTSACMFMDCKGCWRMAKEESRKEK